MAKQKQKKWPSTDGRPLEQIAALPFRTTENGETEVLVMTSRETQRVVIPKGWPMKNRKSWTSAKIEARQEAGVIGDIGRKPIGQYRYWKRLESYFVLVKVAVYPLAVRRQLDDWRERHERTQVWLPAEDAALLVDEPELGALILEFGQSREAHRLTRRAASEAEDEAGEPAGDRRARTLNSANA